MKKIVLAFGRMNPPTVGHEKLVQKIKSVARKEKATPALYLSHSQDKKKNPLSYDDKVKYATKAFGKIVKKTNARTIIEVLKELDRQYDEVIVVGGSDRVDEFKNLLTKYNGKDYAYEKLDVVSAGERDPDADDVSGMSASKLRELAVTGKVKEFRAGIPAKLRQSKDGAEMYDKIRTQMGISEDMTLDEVLNLQQRIKKRMVMKRIKNKIKIGRKKAKFRMANKTKLTARAQKKAREMLRGRLAGSLGKNYKKLGLSQRAQIDKKLEGKKAIISRLAKRLMPKVKKAEMTRLSNVRKTRNEEIEQLAVIESVYDTVMSEHITERVERNLMKKSEKYGVNFEELKDKYLAYKSEMSENATFNAINSELANEAMSPASQKAHRNMFRAAQKKKDNATAQRERETRLKAKGWVRNDRGGMTKITEDDKPNKRGDDAKGHKRPTEDGAGLTRKGAKAAGLKPL
jgi:nicotinamide mononucleotide adenylyltransferase